MSPQPGVPVLRQVVLDTTDVRALAEFYRRLLNLQYRPGDEHPGADAPDPRGQDWLVLRRRDGSTALAFQKVEQLPPATWPNGGDGLFVRWQSVRVSCLEDAPLVLWAFIDQDLNLIQDLTRSTAERVSVMPWETNTRP